MLTENLGDDRIAATRLGIANLERAMGYLVDATTRLGGDYDKLAQTYDTILEHRYLWLSSVVKLIGGVEETRTLAGRGEAQFHRVPKASSKKPCSLSCTTCRRRLSSFLAACWIGWRRLGTGTFASSRSTAGDLLDI